MARLIDADEFEVISWRAQGGSGDYKNGFDDGVNYVAQKIDKAQTVDAIPVEWLKGLMLSTDDDVDNVEFAWIMRKWRDEQEAR